MLFVSLLTSAVGFALFKYGRKQERLPQVIGGLALMLYPYFFSTFAGLVTGGALICAGVWLAIRLGW